MKRPEKMHVISELTREFDENKAAFLVDYKGLTVAQAQQFRKMLRAQGGFFKVAKARLMRRAAQEGGACKDLIPLFKDQVGLVFASKEALPIVKIIVDFSRENESLKVVAGCMEEGLIDAVMIQRLALLPSREVLLAQLCGVMKGPIAAFARAIQLIKEGAEQKK